jgi:hypothetical protein
MAHPVPTRYVAECFSDGVREEDLREFGRRIQASVVALGDGAVRYLGGLLVIEDEVVLLEFEGPIGPVRRVAEHARIPFGRILRVVHAPWPPNPTDDRETQP